MVKIVPPRHIIWSTDAIDLADPFQRKWYIRQVLLYGRSEDLQILDLDEVSTCLEELHLPPEINDLWKKFFEHRHQSAS
jgi:hypothetical protein